MVQTLLRGLAFLAAYAPLWAILAVQTGGAHNPWAAAGLTIVALLPAGLTLIYVQATHAEAAGEPLKVAGVARLDEAVMTYLFTYVLPFIGLKLGTPQDLLSGAVFLVLLFILYVRTNLFYVNPLLSAMNYRIYEIQIDNAPPKVLLSRKQFIQVGQTIWAAPLLDDDVLMQVTK